MPVTPTEVDVVVNAERVKYVFVSLHTANPGTTGTSEATGGSPAYARKALALAAASSNVSTAPSVTFDAAAGTYTHFGVWSASTAGTFYGGNPLSASQVLGGQGTIPLVVTLTGTAT